MSRRARRPQQPSPARTPVDLVQAVVEAVARGELDDELAVLGAVINERVRLNHNAKPNYLHGRAGTVSGWAGQNVVVQLDQPVGRFTTGELRCPPLVLEPLAPE